MVALCALVAASMPVRADAPQPPAVIPVPQARPTAQAIDTSVTTAGIPGQISDAVRPDIPLPKDISRLKAGLDTLTAKNVDAAEAVLRSLPQGSLDRHILAWAIALNGGDAVSSGEIEATAKMLPGWPGMAALRRNAERALFREAPAPQAVIKAFGGTPPQTPEGAIILARSHMALGDRKAAAAVIVPFWRTTNLEAKDEEAILSEFGFLIPPAIQHYRMEYMLYEGRTASAKRVADRAGAKELADAWTAVIKGSGDAGRLLKAVPESQRDAGYLFAQIRYLRRNKDFEEAARLMLKAPKDAAALIDADEWWHERRALSRELLDKGDARTAYALVAEQVAESPAAAADAEFHAGWYALTALNEPKTAAAHFAKIADISNRPLSLSRAYYWLGRAAERGGPGNAAAYFSKAAQYGMTFYGQLAAERIGRNTIDVTYPKPSEADRERFAGREAVKAIKRLQLADYGWRANLLYQDLARELTSPGELALLAVMAEKDDNNFMALRVGKIAASRGLDIGALAHPIGVIPASARIDLAGEALCYAVARQESEFNVAAISAAGARGLLQLLPGTAKAMAKKAGLPYSASRLVTDAAYNATLGSAFLAQQLARFDGSYVLTIAGYNAGPRRAQEWVERYGDPRGKSLDTAIDWIERIPYTETRNYVQRVMENFEIYKMRLSGHFDLAGDLVKGR
jgi:soluble lytic murein transglycosylase